MRLSIMDPMRFMRVKYKFLHGQCKCLDESYGQWPSTPVFCAEDCLQLELCFQPHIDCMCPRGSIYHHVHIDGFCGLYSQPYVTLSVVIYEECKDCGSKEVNDFEAQIYQTGRLSIKSTTAVNGADIPILPVKVMFMSSVMVSGLVASILIWRSSIVQDGIVLIAGYKWGG